MSGSAEAREDQKAMLNYFVNLLQDFSLAVQFQDKDLAELHAGALTRLYSEAVLGR